MLSVNSLRDYISEALKHSNEQKEAIIRAQLNELLERGLLEIQQQEPILVQHPDSNQVEIRQAVKLVLKDHNYIEQLEEENAKLKEDLTKIKELLNV